MGSCDDFLSFYYESLIKGSFITFFVLISVYWAFLEKEIAFGAFEFLKWILLVFSILSIVYYPLSFITGDNHIGLATFMKRITGPYAFAYGIMMLGSVSPMLLLVRKLGAKLYVLFVITIWVNIGWLMESFIIHTSAMHREFVQVDEPLLPFKNELFIFFKGFLLGSWLLFISWMYQKKNRV